MEGITYTKISIVGLDLFNKIIFIITGIRRLFKIKKDMNIDKKYLLYSSSNMENPQLQKVNKQKWTFPSMSKFILNKLIILLYIAIFIVGFINIDFKESETKFFLKETNQKIIFSIFCFISCITWLISTRVFYKEFRIYKDQTFKGIRIFWIINNILNIILLICYYLLCILYSKFICFFSSL